MGYRWRRMYYLTGLPGWIRFGYSPGWLGRSPTGLPPTAQWLIQSGLIPPPAQPPTQPITPQSTFPYPFQQAPTREQEKQFLEQQAKMLENQIEEVRRRIEELKGSPQTSTTQQNQPSMFPMMFPPMPAYPPIQQTPEEELASLEAYKKDLEEEIKGVKARMDELKKLLERSKTQKT